MNPLEQQGHDDGLPSGDDDEEVEMEVHISLENLLAPIRTETALHTTSRLVNLIREPDDGRHSTIQFGDRQLRS